MTDLKDRALEIKAFLEKNGVEMRNIPPDKRVNGVVGISMSDEKLTPEQVMAFCPGGAACVEGIEEKALKRLAKLANAKKHSDLTGGQGGKSYNFNALADTLESIKFDPPHDVFIKDAIKKLRLWVEEPLCKNSN
jgi:hypothetical protein